MSLELSYYWDGSTQVSMVFYLNLSFEIKIFQLHSLVEVRSIVAFSTLSPEFFSKVWWKGVVWGIGGTPHP